jgi:hypothetical protein
MESNNRAASKCSNCQFFSPDGCRYGHCRILNVSVEGKGSPCVLFVAAFERAELQEKPADLVYTAA